MAFLVYLSPTQRDLVFPKFKKKGKSPGDEVVSGLVGLFLIEFLCYPKKPKFGCRTAGNKTFKRFITVNA